MSGIYTTPDTKDLGDVLDNPKLKGIKIRGWIEGYYVTNTNHPSKAVVNANQGASVVKGTDVTIEGRLFDVHRDRLTANLAEIELEKVPDLRKFGFKVDVATGDTMNLILNTINGYAPGTVSSFDKTFQHASISYLAPIGKGLRLDVGKFVTHIGGETIESIKNRNFSHSFYYTYAIPFQDTGVRMNYAFNPKIYGELYVIRGWNVTRKDNNGRLSYGPSIGWTPNAKWSVFANYMTGPEQTGDNADKRKLGDFQVYYVANPKLSYEVNLDIGRDTLPGGASQKWDGVAFYATKTVNDRFMPTARIEYYNDPQGFTTGVVQHMWGYTLTGDYKLKIGSLGKRPAAPAATAAAAPTPTNPPAEATTKAEPTPAPPPAPNDAVQLLLRPEIRYDNSSGPFFSNSNTFRAKKNQLTIGVGLVAYF